MLLLLLLRLLAFVTIHKGLSSASARRVVWIVMVLMHLLLMLLMLLLVIKLGVVLVG